MFTELRFALRRMVQDADFSAPAILPLGANACVFGVIYGLRYVPSPLAQADRLVIIDI